MKQHITVEQLNELSEKGKKKLQLWLWGKGYTLSSNQPVGFSYMMSIGQMVEFLDEHLKTDWSICSGKNLLFFGRSDWDGIFGKTPKNRKGELCDALWEAVKEVLGRGDDKS